MEQLIDKSALVEKIERILSIYTKRYEELAKYEVWITAKEIEHRIQGLKEALSIIDTLEVKVEATTTADAFIEKACEFLFENYHGEKLSLRMIENFRKYMKGE